MHDCVPGIQDLIALTMPSLGRSTRTILTCSQFGIYSLTPSTESKSSFYRSTNRVQPKFQIPSCLPRTSRSKCLKSWALKPLTSPMPSSTKNTVVIQTHSSKIKLKRRRRKRANKVTIFFHHITNG